MKLMITSFGIEQAMSAPLGEESVFHRMPPVSFRSAAEAFMPDYELLVLCDQIVMDGSSFQQLVDEPVHAYAGVADTFRALSAEGRVELVDFSGILSANADLLNKMLDHDMAVLDQWVAPLRESLALWQDFRTTFERVMWHDGLRTGYAASTHDARGPASENAVPGVRWLHHVAGYLHDATHAGGQLSVLVNEALDSSGKRRQREYRGALREALRAYLAYVNANLVLSNQLGIGFHDWRDLTPFYATKFLSVGKSEDPAWKEREQVERLFTVAFPDLAIRSATGLTRVLNDKRVEELRQLVGDAVCGKVQFDERFAASVLTDVLHGEQASSRVRRVVGYATLPIGLIPWIGTPAQKVVEEAIGTPIERKIKREHRWFYMLSDVAEAESAREREPSR